MPLELGFPTLGATEYIPCEPTDEGGGHTITDPHLPLQSEDEPSAFPYVEAQMCGNVFFTVFELYRYS